MRLEDEGVMAADMARDHVEIDRASAGRAVIAALLIDIMEMESDETIEPRGEVGLVIEKTLEVFDAGVPGVMPVADRRILGEVGEEGIEPIIERQFENAFAVFNAEDEAVIHHGGEQLVVTGEDPLHCVACSSPEPREGLLPGGGEGRWIGL